MPRSSSLAVRSYAKINWTLDVLFRRADGFHELRTIYQTISLHDRLLFQRTQGAIEISCDDSRVPVDKTNLVHRAAVALREATGATLGARIHIEKRIPVAAGLGGGSSNAAATLIALQRLWGVRVDEAASFALAADLGSDVPLFLIGGTVLGVGRGEEVYPIEEPQRVSLVLANPGFPVATAAAYAGLSRLTMQESVRMIPFTLLAAKRSLELPLAARNDFEEVVLAGHPEIAELKRKLISLGARHAVMSGSGATVLGVFDKLETSWQAQSELRAAGIWSEGVSTVSRREYQETMIEREEP